MIRFTLFYRKWTSVHNDTVIDEVRLIISFQLISCRKCDNIFIVDVSFVFLFLSLYLFLHQFQQTLAMRMMAEAEVVVAIAAVTVEQTVGMSTIIITMQKNHRGPEHLLDNLKINLYTRTHKHAHQFYDFV